MNTEFEEIYAKIRRHTLVSKDRCFVLYNLLLETKFYNGDVFECGVYKGGTAMLIASTIIRNKSLHLFDTFSGMPEVSELDNHHKKGDFKDTSFDLVFKRINDIKSNGVIFFHQGIIPETFIGLENVKKLSFSHIDLDIYESVRSATEFIYPRTTDCGVIIYDDYGFDTCKGAKIAVDEFYKDKPERIEILPTNQAIVRKISDV